MNEFEAVRVKMAQNPVLHDLRVDLSQSPSKLGYLMPAEWENHFATILAWPVAEEWRCAPETIFSAYAQFVNSLLDAREKVIMVLDDGDYDTAKTFLGEALDRVEIVLAPKDDSWIRDNGPTFLIRRNKDRTELLATKWDFNAWGGKFSCVHDNLVSYHIFEQLGFRFMECPYVLEGGSINVDGEGTLLTTSQCLNQKSRNPKVSPDQMDKILMDIFGVQKVIRLQSGLNGDHTDGHIDNVAVFLAPGVVLTQLTTDSDDPNYEIFQKNYEQLRQETDAKNRKLNVIAVDPPLWVRSEYEKYVTSYVNLVFAKDVVLAPIFGGDNASRDANFLATLEKFFQGRRKIVPVQSNVFVLGGGNIHCLSQQIPQFDA